MEKKPEQYVKKISIALDVVAVLNIIGIILIVSFSDTRDLIALDLDLPPLIFSALLVAVFYFLCSWGIKKHNKIAYYATWFSLLIIILHLRLIGLILAVVMGIWLVKSKKLFLK